MATEKRLIDANALVYYCKEIAKHEWNKRSSPVSWSDAYEGFIDDIDEMPTVSAVEVVHGRWIDTDYKPDIYCKCSECGRRVYAYDDGYNYCPRCGAKMDGGNEDG